ncbi:uncharacterized protein LOC126448892, partial [Schistocerca serialis cubense]|uniref:uncharacterized protein LOC126448892 n=1 Tax=Schistocerca serialis cubense TaxID=2023355 RepID=UPI00214EE4DB
MANEEEKQHITIAIWNADGIYHDRWEQSLQAAERNSEKFWGIIKARRQPHKANRPLHGQNGLVYTPEDKATAMSNTLELQFRENVIEDDEDEADALEQRVERHLHRRLRTRCPMDPNNSCLTAKEDVVPTDRTLSAAASATPPAYSDTASTVGASCAPSGYHPISAVELFVIMNRAAKPTTPAEKEAAEKAYKLFVRHELSAALAQLPPTEASYLLSGLPRSALEEVIVPPGVLPGVATQDAAAPAEAAPSGVASPDVATQEASALLIAPTDNSSEEAASAPVLAVQGLTDSDHPNPTRHPTTPVLLEIPEANLGTLLSAEMPMDAQQASRKRPATSDSEEQTAATAPEGRQTKKKAAAADAPTAPPTAEEDGFTVPNRRHTAKPKRLEKVLAPPPATSNRFAEATEVVMEAEPAAPARKQTRPPPVIVTWDDEFMDLRRMIKEVVE